MYCRTCLIIRHSDILVCVYVYDLYVHLQTPDATTNVIETYEGWMSHCAWIRPQQTHVYQNHLFWYPWNSLWLNWLLPSIVLTVNPHDWVLKVVYASLEWKCKFYCVHCVPTWSICDQHMGLILEFAMFGSLDQISLWSQRIRSFKSMDFYQSLKKVPKFSRHDISYLD